MFVLSLILGFAVGAALAYALADREVTRNWTMAVLAVVLVGGAYIGYNATTSTSEVKGVGTMLAWFAADELRASALIAVLAALVSMVVATATKKFLDRVAPEY